MSKVINLVDKTKSESLIDVLNKLMADNQLTITQLSKNTKLATTTIKRMLTIPDSNPTMASLNKIAKFFSITPDQLTGSAPLSTPHHEYSPDFSQWQTIPIISLAQAAKWPENIDEMENSTDNSYVLTDIKSNEEMFAIVAENESLEPRFSDGTILIFDPTRSPKNKDFILLLAGQEKLPQFRQVLTDGSELYAKVINPELAIGSPMKITPEFRILGVLVQAKSTYL